MLRALIGFLCVCVSISSQAKVGETVPQLIKRFGKSYTVEPVELGKSYRFRSENVSVDAIVANGVSICETYFSDHPLTANGEPPNDIVRAVLKTNVPQALWVEIDAAPFRGDYALRSSDYEFIAVLRYTGAQPENSVWTITVGRAKVVGSLSAVSSSPANSVITPVPTAASTPALSAAPAITAPPTPVRHIDFSPEQFTPSPQLKTFEPPTLTGIAYLATIATSIGAAIFYVIALVKAFRRKTAWWIVAAVLGAVLFGSLLVVTIAESRSRGSQQPLFANRLSAVQSFIKGLYSRSTSPSAQKPYPPYDRSIPKQATKPFAVQRSFAPVPANEDRAFDLPALASAARRAVVIIIGYNASGKPFETGSGFFVSDDGRLVTNWHVVEGIVWAQARTENGAMYNVRGVLASSPSLDLAVLQADAKGVLSLAIDGTAAPPVPGTRVVVIGSPLALEGSFSLSEGIVSAYREDTAGTLLQISAPISHGSSGSPVIDNRGNVIGVVTGAIEQGQNLNFARSAHDLTTLIGSIPADKRPTRFADELSSDPDYVASKAAVDNKDFTLALKFLNRVRERFPRNPRVLFQLGFLYAVLGLHTDAVGVFREYIKIDPTSAATWENLATSLSQLGNFQEAINACYEAIKLEPDNAAAWNTLAICLYRTGDSTGARRALQQAEALSRTQAKQPKPTATPVY